jgi:CHAD domain-containing protein
MRVCCSRLRSVLQAFPDVLDPARTDHLVEELRSLGLVLGQARDIEVLQRRLTAAAEAAPGGPEGLPVHLDAFLRTHQDTAGTAVLEFLDSERYLGLLAALDALVETPPLTADAWRPAAEVLPAAVTAAGVRVGRSLRRATRPDADRDRELHQARKATTRLRYAADAAAPVLPRRRGTRLVEAARRLQDVLGERQDAVRARPLLRELAAAAGTSGAEGFVCGVLHEREAAHVLAAEHDLTTAWRSVRRHLT